MRRVLLYILLFALVAVSCERRPLKTADFAVQLNINLNKDVINYDVEKDPSIMRCIFYNSETGAFVTQTFLPPTGGVVNLVPSKTYDVLVYNFDTESTWIQDENWFDKIFASTSLIPDSFKTKLRSRSSKTDEEQIVYDPDHLYVGRLNDVFIPARSDEAPMVVLDINVESVVQSWVIELDAITGIENIGSVAGVVTALARKNHLGTNTRSDEYASVYFDTPVIDEKGHLTAKFNTFGRNENCPESQVLSLVFIDIAGNGRTFNFDVTDEFINNKDQVIRLTKEIDIPKPMTSGSGGFVPKVDPWEDINTEIII